MSELKRGDEKVLTEASPRMPASPELKMPHCRTFIRDVGRVPLITSPYIQPLANSRGGAGRSPRRRHCTTEALLTVIVVEHRLARRSIYDGRLVINDRRIAIDDAWLAIHYGWLAIHDRWLLVHDRRGTGPGPISTVVAQPPSNAPTATVPRIAFMDTCLIRGLLPACM
jgi:hypothetical protein